MVCTINNDEEEPVPTFLLSDYCTECGASFEMHLEFGKIMYMKRRDMVAEFMTDLDYMNPVVIPVENYGVCMSYKSSL